jgi:hypothetical protein
MSKSRRSVLRGLAAAPVLTIPGLALAVPSADAELIALAGRYFHDEAQRPDEVSAPAAYERFLDDMHDLTNRIAALPAPTPQGLAEKALIALDHDMQHDEALVEAVVRDAARLGN